MTIQRYELEPDPAWDGCEEDDDGVLTVELSWKPDALAARAPDIVASPALAAALTAAGLTGFRTGEARGTYDYDQVFDVEEGELPPPLVRLVVGDDPRADFSYARPAGLTVSPAALAVLHAHCERLDATPMS